MATLEWAIRETLYLAKATSIRLGRKRSFLAGTFIFDLFRFIRMGRILKLICFP